MKILVPLLSLLMLAGCAQQYEGYKYKPYTIRGVRYHPMHPRAAVGFVETGTASHYTDHFLFFPGKTAIGESHWPWSRLAAHKTLPLPSVIRVTNLRNGKSMKLRVNDRGPYVGDRILDVSRAAADHLGFTRQGLAPVRIEVLSVGDGKYRIRR